MSEPIGALGGAVFDGLARIADCGLQGMIALRGDLAARAVHKAVTSATGGRMPGRREVRSGARGTACWMSPDEVLVLVPYAAAEAQAGAMRAVLGRTHALAVDVSDARAMLQVSGPAAREVMAKLCPVDLSPQGFGPGMFRRTRLAQVAAAIWMPGAEEFRVVCFRSVAEYALDVLTAAAHPQSAVGAF